MIKVLDSFVADKIAAGEVIERPVSAIKELVENSIDAGARSVIVEIRGGGKSYIRVTDDGSGIPSDEAETAFLRHATSKISSITDLDNISSLGFRGEALASISAVSRLTMVTRTDDQPSGIKLVLHGGRLISSERTGANRGTTMIAEDLFYNTPARRKFMKSDAREASAVIELIQQFAVYYADIRFMMISNGRTVFTTSGSGDVLSVLADLYPDIGAARLIPVSGSNVRGYVSDPGSTRSTRKGQLFFVNGRIVSSSLIEKAVEEGYQGRIFSGFPAAILFISAEPHDIDVNIHPGKREIRFLRQDDVRKDISAAVSEAVMTEAGIPKAESVLKHSPDAASAVRSGVGGSAPAEKGDPHEDASAAREVSAQTSMRDYLSSLARTDEGASVGTYPGISPHRSGEAHDGSRFTSAADTPAYGVITAADSSDTYTAGHKPAGGASPSGSSGAVRPKLFDFDELEFKGYVFDTYIIMQAGDSLYVFDQHAAHERVFYEKFLEGYNKTTHTPQPILTPFTIGVSADVYFNERAWVDDLISMGYDIEDFGDRTFMVRGIPSFMSLDEASGFARGYAEAASEAGGRNDAVIDKLIMRSCKSAVKAKDRLSERETGDLIRKLSECGNPYSCPHGRPTFIKISSYDIERAFRRK